MSDAPACVVCGAETRVTAACPHCAEPVCRAHRDPASHGCAGVDSDGRSGWVIDLDGPQPTGASDADDSWRDVFSPSRSGLLLAAGTLFVVCVAVLVVSLAGPQLGEVVASAGSLNETAVEHEIAAEVNEERRRAGLEPLAYDAALAEVGHRHSTDMRDRGFVDHRNPDGDSLSDRYAEVGLSCPGGENIYYTPNGRLAASPGALADHVVRSWMNSDGHREALLKERFTRQGVGVVVGPDGALYVTQDFC